jgi:hypothetical protein
MALVHPTHRILTLLGAAAAHTPPQGSACCPCLTTRPSCAQPCAPHMDPCAPEGRSFNTVCMSVSCCPQHSVLECCPLHAGCGRPPACCSSTQGALQVLPAKRQHATPCVVQAGTTHWTCVCQRMHTLHPTPMHMCCPCCSHGSRPRAGTPQTCVLACMIATLVRTPPEPTMAGLTS